jgi:hypothetical protein
MSCRVCRQPWNTTWTRHEQKPLVAHDGPAKRLLIECDDTASGVVSGRVQSACCAAIKVRTRDNQGEKVFCRLRRREGEARPEAQATEHLA